MPLLARAHYLHKSRALNKGMEDTSRSTPISSLPAPTVEEYDESSDAEDSTDVSEMDDAPAPAPPPRAVRARARASASPRCRRKRATVASDSGPSDSSVTRLLRAFSNTAVLQAIVLSFVVIFAMAASPLASMALARAPFLDRLPFAETAVTALLSAIAITALRPPRPV